MSPTVCGRAKLQTLEQLPLLTGSQLVKHALMLVGDLPCISTPITPITLPTSSTLLRESDPRIPGTSEGYLAHKKTPNPLRPP
jgi:hypothetical protein